MRVFIYPDANQAGAAAAAEVQTAFNAKPKGVLGVATGSSPGPLYAQLRAAHAADGFTLAQASAFALDEYVGLAGDHRQRYRNVLRAELVGDDKTGLPEANLHTPDGLAADPNLAAEAYDEEIAAAGGVDIQILGIGANGHIGFNEPLGSLRSRTHVGTLTEQTRRDNARFFDEDFSQVPTHCLTQGLGTIMEARRLLLVASGERKAKAVHQMIEGPISAMWPATLVQLHPNAMVLLDEAAASKIKHRHLLASVAR